MHFTTFVLSYITVYAAIALRMQCTTFVLSYNSRLQPLHCTTFALNKNSLPCFITLWWNAIVNLHCIELKYTTLLCDTVVKCNRADILHFVKLLKLHWKTLHCGEMQSWICTCHSDLKHLAPPHHLHQANIINLHLNPPLHHHYNEDTY